jgi:hypothetical protein
MKNTLLLLFVLVSTSLLAQYDTITMVHSYSNEQGMRLKWLPTSDEAFLKGYEFGYNIYRAEVLKNADGSEKLGTYSRLNEKRITLWSSDKLKNEMRTDSSLLVAELFIDGVADVINREQNTNVAEAVEQKKEDQMLHLLAMFVTISDNRIAEALGMFWNDNTVIEGKKYMYKIEIPDYDEFTSYHMVLKVKEEIKSKVFGVTAELYPKAVYLKWFNNNNYNYPYFNIYRSTKKEKGYVKLNNLPYTGKMGNASYNKSITSIIDSIPEYGITYYYKIAGVNAFAEEGTYSDAVEIKTSYLLDYAPQIEGSEDVEVSDIKINWAIRSQDAPYIKGFSVFRASKGSGPYLPVNEKEINSKDRSYIDGSLKGSSNYYVVTAYGFSGDSVNSIMHAHLLVDSIAPLKPQNLTGSCDTNGVVTLKWKFNEEPDLKGYRIFKTYELNLDPQRVISGDTLVEEFKDTIDLKMPYNFIYYRIYALDHHFNPSFPSDFVKVPLPDKNAPINGFISSYSVGMSGITIHWKNSTTYDLKTMYLMRKADTDFEFKPILVLNADSLSIETFTDTTTKSFAQYKYALIAEDHSGLQSELSREFLIQQLDKRKVPRVSNLRAVVSQENKMIKLSWDFPENATGFKIMRSRNGEPLETYKYIEGKKREYYDKSLKPKSKYVYLFIAQLKGGYSSGYSKKLEVKY